MVVAGGWGWGVEGEFLYTGYRVLVWKHAKVLEMDGGEGGTTM